MDDEDKLGTVTRDQNLMHANSTHVDNDLASGGSHSIVVTQDVLEEIRGTIDARYAHMQQTYPKLVADCDYQMRLAVVHWVFEQLLKHARSGGSYRYLIFNRLGFGRDAYLPLDLAGGVTLSNILQRKE